MVRLWLRLSHLLVAALLLRMIGYPPTVVQAQTSYPSEYEPHEVLLKLDDDDDLIEIAQQYGLHPLPLDQFGTRPIYRMAIADGILPPEKALALTADIRVVAAEPNYIGQTPTGTAKSSWAGGDGHIGYVAQWAATKIRLPEAHTVTRGAGVTIAVLDTGIDSTHPELLGRIVPGYDFVDMDSIPHEEGSTADQAYGHGTHVAGLIALVAPEAMIMPIRMLAPDGSSTLWVAMEALAFAVNPDGDPETSHDSADIINMSFSFARESRLLEHFVREATCDDDDDDENLCEATDERGVVFVAAAGNSGYSTPEYPAAEAVSGLIAVAASTQHDALASFSNNGSWIQIAAPGNAILSSVPGGYGVWNGTSMAAPLVAGTAALIRAREPSISPNTIVSRMVNAGIDIGGNVPRRLDTAVALGKPRIKPLGDVRCRSSIGAVTAANITVPANASCTLNFTRITGNVKIEAGARLTANGINVIGNIEGVAAAMVAVSSGTLVAGTLVVKEGRAATISNTTVIGSIQIEKNIGTLLITGNTIGGDLQIKENSAAITIHSNNIGSNLQCEKNSLGIAGHSNQAKQFEGQCVGL